jgi:hypothetical protein
MSEKTKVRTCFKIGCGSEPVYVGNTPNTKQIPVCYKHSLQFAPANVSEIVEEYE